MTDPQTLPPGSVDILTLSAPQLSSLQSRLSQDLEHLTTSYTRLRSAQARFRDCIASVKTGVSNQPDRSSILVPLTQSLYVPGQLASTATVIVDVGTGFYVEKTTADALKFYNGKVDDLSKNLAELEKVVQSKNENLRIVEEGTSRSSQRPAPVEAASKMLQVSFVYEIVDGAYANMGGSLHSATAESSGRTGFYDAGGGMRNGQLPTSWLMMGAAWMR